MNFRRSNEQCREHKLDPKGKKAIPLFIVHKKEKNHSTIITLTLFPKYVHQVMIEVKMLCTLYTLLFIYIYKINLQRNCIFLCVFSQVIQIHPFMLPNIQMTYREREAWDYHSIGFDAVYLTDKLCYWAGGSSWSPRPSWVFANQI